MAGGEGSEIRMWVYTQPGAGRTGKSYTTPIADIASEIKESSTKADLQRMILQINDKACQGNVSEEYIKNYAVKNTILMVMYAEKEVEEATRASRSAASATVKRKSKEPLGFISAKVDDDGPRQGLYIDVICAVSNGTNLLHYFIAYAKAQGKAFVGLSSLPSVLSYYPKYGFEFRKTCTGGPLARLPDTIPALLAELKRSGRPFPKTSINTYAHDPYTDFMIELHDKDLSVKKSGKCAKAKITKDELKEDDCGEDGFSMKRCALGGGGRRRCTRKCRRRSAHRRRSSRKH
jgi:hypothetical protein